MEQEAEKGIVIGTLEEIFKDAETAANSNEAVMILGETGVGKEILARYIHDCSRRHRRAFMPINCAAVPATLFESELFGYMKGAFTGADKEKRGLLEEADSGTVFLDEIGDMPRETQAKLLRVIETKEMLPLGSTRYRKIDVRFITATNSDIRAKLISGEFRRDLYYRLSIFLYTIPPLRQRLSDVGTFTRHFIAESDRKVQASPRVMELFICYPWPGNVRELRSVITHALTRCQGSTIELEHLPQYLVESCISPEVLKGEAFKCKVECFEARLLEEALRLDRDPKKVAERLGMELRTLYRKLKKYGLKVRELRNQ